MNIVESLKSRLSQTEIQTLVHFLSGSLAGLAADVATFPLDTLRARNQVSTKSSTKNLLRGIGVVGLVTIPEHAIYFCLYEKLISSMHPELDRDSKPASVYFMSGLIAEVVDIVLFNPVDVIKQKMQISETKIRWSDTWSHPLELYRGVVPNVLCHGPYFGIHWAIYEPLKQTLSPEHKEEAPLSVIIAASTVASSVAAFLTNPMDVVRTRVQTSRTHTTAREMVKQMVKKEGLSSFRRGVLARVLYLAPATAVMISVYELSKSRLYHLFS